MQKARSMRSALLLFSLFLSLNLKLINTTPITIIVMLRLMSTKTARDIGHH